MSTNKNLLYIDGENFRYKTTEILRKAEINTSNKTILNIDIVKLFQTVLSEYKINEHRYYSAKIHLHPASKNKSLELIRTQRILKTYLESKGYKYIVSGNVRAGLIGNPPTTSTNTQRYVFNEKGVDVKIAIDLVLAACDKTADTIILCSSDSDLQPAIKEAIVRGLDVVYLGFKNSPNKGLTYTTSKTILIEDSDIISAYTP